MQEEGLERRRWDLYTSSGSIFDPQCSVAAVLLFHRLGDIDIDIESLYSVLSLNHGGSRSITIDPLLRRAVLIMM